MSVPNELLCVGVLGGGGVVTVFPKASSQSAASAGQSAGQPLVPLEPGEQDGGGRRSVSFGPGCPGAPRGDGAAPMASLAARASLP